MEIGGRYQIGYPAEQAFLTLRDHQKDLVAYLPNVNEMVVLERAEEASIVRVNARWQGSADDIPSAIRTFITPDMLSWTEQAAWDRDTLSCKWRIESVKAKGIFDCEGTSRLLADGDNASVFEMRGDLSVHPESIPGVPGFIAKRIREPVEKFVAKLLNPNLMRMAEAVQIYLDKTSG